MKKFAGKIIEIGRFHLRTQIEDYSVRKPKIGVPFSKKEYEKIKENLEVINDFGKNKNIKISKINCVKDGTPYVFFEYIDPENELNK